MYTMDDGAVGSLAKGLGSIVRNARAIIKNPKDSHYRLENIVAEAQKLLKKLKDGKYRTKASQRMAKPKIN